MILNVEIKARCDDPSAIRAFLLLEGADFKGTDHQRDTYFNVHRGRLKLRQGNIENALIHYLRPDQAGPKTSEVTLCPIPEGAPLESILDEVLGTRVVVDKQREIYFIGNVKFHIDRVEGLGGFVEIEAIDDSGRYSLDELQAQCGYYLNAFGIQADDLLSDSYSDMILRGTT
jgi:adenylate cyclase class 2